MKSIFILLFFISTSCYAQDSLFIGKWQLSEMRQDSMLIFDRNNIQVSIDARYLKEKRKNVVLLHTDSIAVAKSVAHIHPMMKMMFCEFGENKNLKAGILDLKKGEYYFTTSAGTYVIDAQKIGLTINALGSAIQTYYYELSRNTMLLRPIIQGKIAQREYLKYERVE